MKRLTIAISAAALALPLCAQNLPNTTTAVLATPPAAEAGDSPLVRAAKAARKNATGKKTVVITNETLAVTGGHMATAGSDVAALPKLSPGTTGGEEELKNARATAETTARREAGAARLQKLKTAPEELFQDEAASRNSTTMTTSQITLATTTQVTTATTNQPNTAATASANQTLATSQPAAMTTAQPQTVTTVTPPQE